MILSLATHALKEILNNNRMDFKDGWISRCNRILGCSSQLLCADLACFA